MNAGLRRLGIRPLVLLGAMIAILGSFTNSSTGQGCYLIQPGGLIGWWRGEGNAADSAGAHPGTPVNGVGFAPAKVGLGFALSGANDYVALAPNLFFNYPSSGMGNGPFSFELWFSTFTGGVILGQQNTAPFQTPSAYVPAIYVGTDGRLYVAMFWDLFARIISPGAVNDGTFHHVAVTYDGATEVVYLDGTVIGSRPFTQLGYASTYYYQLGTGYTAGLWPAANGDWFNFDGILDEVSLYNRALAASEVAGIYQAGSSGKCPLYPPLLPAITSQPASQTVPPGANATFSVTAINGPLTYQWQFNGQNLANSAHYAGATSSMLTVVGVAAPDAGSYRVVVSNAGGSTTSTAATLAVQQQQGCVPAPPGLIAWYKAEADARDSADSHHGTAVRTLWYAPGKVGTGFSFDGAYAFVDVTHNLFPYPTSGSGNAPFSFETWFSTTTGGVILGQQNSYVDSKPSAYVPAVYVGTDGRLYISMFWDWFARIISPGTVNDGAFHHVAVTYDGTTEVAYLDGTVIGSTPFTQLGYTTDYSYQLGTGYTAGLWPAANGEWFYFRGIIDEASIYNRALTASEVVGIFVAGSSGKCSQVSGTAPQVTTQPTNRTVPPGANVSFNVTATGTAPLTYQWQFNGQNLANSGHYAGATGNTLTIFNVGPSDVGSYRAIVANAFGSTTSAAATLALQQQANCTPAPSGLIAWYKAEGNPSDSADSLPASTVNAVQYSSGKVGLGFGLPGGNAFVQLPPNLFPYPTTGNSGNSTFSFETWFSTVSGGVILGQQEGNQTGYPFATPDAFVPGVYVGHDGRLYVQMFWDVFAQIISPGTVNNGAFHHVAVTYDGSIETVYLDGIVIGSRFMTQLGYAASYYYQLGTGFTYGWPSGNNGWFPFTGIIDEASVYNRALSASEVGAIVAAASAGKCPPAPRCAAAPAGLIGWWKADGSAADVIGGNNGVLRNVTFTSGMVGQAFALDPQGTYAGVQVPDRPAYALTDSLSVEAWIRPRGDGSAIFWRGDNRPGMDPYILSMELNNVVTFLVTDASGNTAQVHAALAYNQWWHVAGTLDGRSGILSIYVNGALAQQITTSVRPFGSLLANNSPGVGIGNVNDGFNNFPFVGDIDEVSLYNRALTPAEVQAIFSAGSAGKCLPSSGQPPQITGQPSNTIVPAGGNAHFLVTATGSSPLSYQWQFNGQNLANSPHYSGATGPELTVMNVTAVDAGSYRVVVSNPFGTANSATATLTVPQQNCAAAPPGLIAWYRAEGNTLDSADAHQGAPVGGVGFRAGPVGLGFDVGGGAYVALPQNLFPYPTSGSGNAPFSFEVWFGTLADGVILGQQDTTPFNKPAAYMPAVYVGTDGHLYVSMFWDWFARIISPGTVNDGAWHHVVATYDGTSEVVYLDGTAMGSEAFTQLAYASSYYYQLGTGYTAGLWPAGNNGWFSFDGIIDEASVYNRALNASEVLQIFMAGSGGKCPMAGALAPEDTNEAAEQLSPPPTVN